MDIDPDGSTKNVDQALSWKNEFSKRTDAKMAITTQFSFDADSVITWANNVKESGIDIPIHIGIAGPAKLQTLLRYSIECGVGASIKIIQKRAMDLTKLLLPYKPTNIITEKQLDGVYNRHVENIPILVSKRENEFFLEG